MTTKPPFQLLGSMLLALTVACSSPVSSAAPQLEAQTPALSLPTDWEVRGCAGTPISSSVTTGVYPVLSAGVTFVAVHTRTVSPCSTTSYTTLHKIKGAGGSGSNMFAIDHVPSYELGTQTFDGIINAFSVVGNETIIALSSGKVLKVIGVGGNGPDMFGVTETPDEFVPTPGRASSYVGQSWYSSPVIGIHQVQNHLFVALASGVLFKTSGAGGSGHNMWASSTNGLTETSGGPNDGHWNYWLGSQKFLAPVSAVWSDGSSLVVASGQKLLKVAGLGGTGPNMFNVSEWEKGFSDEGRLGDQYFSSTIRGVWPVGQEVLIALASGVLMKGTLTGSTGSNIYACLPDATGEVPEYAARYNEWLGATSFQSPVTDIESVDGSLLVASGRKLLKVRGMGGRGWNMFAATETASGWEAVSPYPYYAGDQQYSGAILDITSYDSDTFVALTNGVLMKGSGAGGTGHNIFTVSADGAYPQGSGIYRLGSQVWSDGGLVDLAWYDGVGTGLLDATDSIGRAFAALTSGDVLFVPPGTWLVKAPRQLPLGLDDVTILGSGDPAAPSTLLYDYKQPIDANGTNIDRSNMGSLLIVGEWCRSSDCEPPVSNERLAVRNLTLRYARTGPSEFYFTRPCVVDNNLTCHISNQGSISGLAVVGPIDGLSVTNVKAFGFNRAGLLVSPLNDWIDSGRRSSESPTRYVRNVTVTGGEFSDNRAAGIFMGNVDGATVSGAELKRNGLLSRDANGNVITPLDYSTGYGFCGSIAETPRNVTLRGNHTWGNARKGIDFHQGRNITIVNNKVEADGLYGIHVEGTRVSKVVIEGNQVVDSPNATFRPLPMPGSTKPGFCGSDIEIKDIENNTTHREWAMGCGDAYGIFVYLFPTQRPLEASEIPPSDYFVDIRGNTLQRFAKANQTFSAWPFRATATPPEPSHADPEWLGPVTIQGNKVEDAGNVTSFVLIYDMPRANRAPRPTVTVGGTGPGEQNVFATARLIVPGGIYKGYSAGSNVSVPDAGNTFFEGKQSVEPTIHVQTPQCEDGFDNDGDGNIDFVPPGGKLKDSECSSARDDSEQCL